MFLWIYFLFLNSSHFRVLIAENRMQEFVDDIPTFEQLKCYSTLKKYKYISPGKKKQ